VDWYLPAGPHSVTAQKTNIDIFTAVRTSDIIQELGDSQNSPRSGAENKK
jgi:hypothetical protein